MNSSVMMVEVEHRVLSQSLDEDPYYNSRVLGNSRSLSFI
jgi:hypothetical protein